MHGLFIFDKVSQGYVYIIYSEKWDQYYVGSSGNVENRIEAHNAGMNKSTRGGALWVLKHVEEHENETAARKREYAIKKKKSRKYIEWLISSAG